MLLSVRDFGPGVTENHITRLAEPFYRPDQARARSTGGVGLGLYLCRQIAEAHGGTLSLRNAHPGLEVVVSFPLQVDPERMGLSSADSYTPLPAA